MIWVKLVSNKSEQNTTNRAHVSREVMDIYLMSDLPHLVKSNHIAP